MRILEVITGMQKAAGTSVFCGELSNELAERGYDVAIAVCNPASSNCYPLDSRVRLISLESVARCTASDFDLIHIHALWSPALHQVARLARNGGIPIVWSPHGMLQKWALKNKWWKKLLALALYQWRDLCGADLLHATARSEVEDIHRLWIGNKIVVAPLGARIPDVDVSQVRGFASDIKTLLFVSRVQRKKGLPNLIEAWRRLPQDLRNGWQVRIVGPDQDNHTAELKAQCDRLGITYSDGSDSVLDLGQRLRPNFLFVGPKYGSELDAEYANANLFVLPTHSENFGSVVVEALAHGVPVITTKEAPWAELEEFKCGWWIEDAVDKLTVTLQDAIQSGDLREMGGRGRKLVEERYAWPAVCDKMIRGYEEVLYGRA